MKTLILYATKYGCTKSLAQRLQSLIEDSTLCNLKSEPCPSLAEFDSVIIGSSIYASFIRKEAKTYIDEHIDELKTKRVGLFLSGLDEAGASTYFSTNFPAAILDIAYAQSFFGGVYDANKASLFDKLIFKVIKKTSSSVSQILEENIVTFARDMKESGA
ncbi:MAG: flavodoxin domain-containing protein [Clostridiales Family XIII bacterium]|jgi:menaquinone-dependent protoporphyrinogen oxidase|nr:flavodoxin domain-containing protein [Clostridiales Family XIII bacterium]